MRLATICNPKVSAYGAMQQVCTPYPVRVVIRQNNFREHGKMAGNGICQYQDRPIASTGRGLGGKSATLVLLSSEALSGAGVAILSRLLAKCSFTPIPHLNATFIHYCSARH